MGAMAAQITSVTIVYSTVYTGANQRKHLSSASLAFVQGIHRSPHKWPVTRKLFSFDDIIMYRNAIIRLCVSSMPWQYNRTWSPMWLRGECADIAIVLKMHDDVIKWERFPRYWPFVRGIQRSPVNSPNKGQWRGALMFSLICAWINDWVNNCEAGDLRRHRGHYDVNVMVYPCLLQVARRALHTMTSISKREHTENPRRVMLVITRTSRWRHGMGALSASLILSRQWASLTKVLST